MTSTGRQIIAPFFGDVDTRSGGSPVTFGQDTVNGRPAFAANWVDVNDSVEIKNNQKIILGSSDITLTQGSQTWNDPYYVNSEYKISLTTSKGNFMTTVASPFNT